MRPLTRPLCLAAHRDRASNATSSSGRQSQSSRFGLAAELCVTVEGPHRLDSVQTCDVAVEPLDFDTLVGSWRRAFEAARRALEAGRHDLPATETAVRSHRLADERAATVRVLDSFARERQLKQFLVRLVATSWESKRLLGVPADAVACVFNVDGVLVPSSTIHAEAWKATFDELITRLIERTGVPFPSFSMSADYPQLIHGRSRIGSVHEFLASRGITLPDGSPDDAPGT